MAKSDPHFRLRIPAELKAEIEIAAKESNRSINAEIVLRLHESFRKADRGAGDVSWTIILEALPPGSEPLKMTVAEFMQRFAAASPRQPDLVVTSPSGETHMFEVKSGNRDRTERYLEQSDEENAEEPTGRIKRALDLEPRSDVKKADK